MGERIYLLRQRIPRYRTDQGALAEDVEVRRETVSAWENDRQTPQGKNLERLAGALRVSEQVVLSGHLDLADRLARVIGKWEAHLDVLQEYDKAAAEALRRCIDDLKGVIEEAGSPALRRTIGAGKDASD